MTFRQLEVFEAIARHGSFTRAAEELFVTQPTASMQIRRLSESVGLPLFEQIGKRIHLTDAGRELYTACREVFDRIDRFEMQVADMKGLKKGRLRLAVVTTAKYFAPSLLGQFYHLYPGIEVALKVTNREHILERLADNLDDLCILGQPPEEIDAEYQPFLENPLVLLAPADHPLVGRRRIPLARIAEEPFLMREAGSGTRMAVERLFEAHRLKIKVRMELGSNEAIKQAIIGGLGISVLSQHAIGPAGSGAPFAILDAQGFPIERHWYAAYSRGKQLSVIARAFLDFLLEAKKHLAALPGTAGSEIRSRTRRGRR